MHIKSSSFRISSKNILNRLIFNCKKVKNVLSTNKGWLKSIYFHSRGLKYACFYIKRIYAKTNHFFTVQDIEDSLNPSIKQSFNIRTFVCCIQALLFPKMPHMNSKNNQEEVFSESIISCLTTTAGSITFEFKSRGSVSSEQLFES